MRFLFLSKERHHHMINFLSKKGNVDWKKDRLSKKKLLNMIGLFHMDTTI